MTPHLDNLTQMASHLLRGVYVRCIQHERGERGGWTRQQEDAALTPYTERLERDTRLFRRLMVQAVAQVTDDELGKEVNG